MTTRPANPLVSPLDDDRWFRERSSLARLAHRWYDDLASHAVLSHGAAAVRRLRRVAGLLHACGVVPPRPSAVRALLPELRAAEASRAARDAAGQRFVNRAMAVVCQRRQLHRLAGLVCAESAAMPEVIRHRRSGLVVATWHLGAHFGLPVAAARWGVPLFVLRDQGIGTPEARAIALKEGLDAARGGRVVAAVVDGPGGASCAPVPWLGRQVRFRRGPFVLARLAGVPIVPVIAQWTEAGEIRISWGPAVDPVAGPAAESETAMAVAVAAWASDHARAFPADVRPYTLGNLLDAPASPVDDEIRAEAIPLDAGA